MQRRCWQLTCLFLLLALPLRWGAADDLPQISAFTSDLKRVTPAAAESGSIWTTLHWQVEALRAGDHVRLQVRVLGNWHDALADDLAAAGTLRWVVPHTLDFAPPVFRLVVVDDGGRLIVGRELLLPYAPPEDRPAFVYFTSPTTAIHEAELRATDFVLPVQWQVAHRPARANVIFEQLVMQTAYNIEIPRAHRWIPASGTGIIRPRYAGNTVVLRARLVNIDTGSVYAEASLTLPVISTPQPTPLPGLAATRVPTPLPQQPVITQFSADQAMPQRGQTLILSWMSANATTVSLQIFDVDYFPRSFAPSGVIREFTNLPPAGSLQVAIPVDYGGAGWQIHLTASQAGQPPFAVQRYDVLFADVPPQILLNVRQFTIMPETIAPGSTLTLTWDTTVTQRISRNGRISHDEPVASDTNSVWLQVVGMQLPGTDGRIPSDIQMYRGLPLQGTLTLAVPDYAPGYNQIAFNLGLEVAGTDITYAVETRELTGQQP